MYICFAVHTCICILLNAYTYISVFQIFICISTKHYDLMLRHLFIQFQSGNNEIKNRKRSYLYMYVYVKQGAYIK